MFVLIWYPIHAIGLINACHEQVLFITQVIGDDNGIQERARCLYPA